MATIQTFKASFPDHRLVNDIQEFYGNAKRLFPDYVAQNIYNQDQKAAFYVYEQKLLEGSHTGIIALASIEDYIKGDIVRHENTLAEKEATMLRLLEERNAMIKPTVLAYAEQKNINKLIEKYKSYYKQSLSLCHNNSLHIVWKVTKEKHIKELRAAFEKVPKSYIADGHHRAATSRIRYEKLKSQNPNHDGTESYNYLFSVFFSEDQLKIHEFNRVVLTLNHYTTSGFRQELRKNFIIEKCDSTYQPQTKYEIGMYIERKWYKLTPKERLLHGSTLDRLAVSVWNDKVLKMVLNIRNVREDNRIKYVEGPKGSASLEKKVGKNNFAVGFTFYPVDWKDLMEIADAGETMPPKSTWFTPRMYNGILAQIFD